MNDPNIEPIRYFDVNTKLVEERSWFITSAKSIKVGPVTDTPTP